MEPRLVGLFQTIQPVITHRAKAVLEQPSPRCEARNTLGRRSIVLAETAS
jgi:hypothetical protein